MKYLVCILSIIFFQFHLSAQLDIASVSFDIQKEIPGEIHLPDSVEYRMFLDVYEKSGDTDSALLAEIDCVWYFSHDSTYMKNYSIACNIHILDINGDNRNDFILDFSIWGCTAYIGKAYISNGDSFRVLKFHEGFITKVSIDNSEIKSIQSKIFGGEMYGFNMIYRYDFNANAEYVYELEYLYDSDSLMRNAQVEREVYFKRDSVVLYKNPKTIMEEELFYNGKVKLNSRKVQILKTEEKYCLVIVEVVDNGSYESEELKPQKHFISAWMKKEDLE